jgi:hypothetical protein
VPVTDMSQHLPFPPPPPPPPPQGSASPRAGPSPYFTPQQRSRPGPAQPPSITTNFLRTQGVGSHPQTPASAVGSTPHSALSYAATPSAAYPDAGHLLDPSRAHLQSPASPSMAQQPYNPRQWSGHGSHLAYSQQPSPLSRANVEVTGMEGEFNCNASTKPQLIAQRNGTCCEMILQVRCLRRILQLQCLRLRLHTHQKRLT